MPLARTPPGSSAMPPTHNDSSNYTRYPEEFPGRVLPNMGYIGMCRGIGYGFCGPRFLNRVSFLPLLAMRFGLSPLVGHLLKLKRVSAKEWLF